MAKALVGLGLGSGWIIGVSAAVFEFPLRAILLLLLFALLGAAWNKTWRNILSAGTVAFLLAFFHTQFQMAWLESGRNLPYGEVQNLRGYIASEPVRNGESQRFLFEPDPSNSGKILVFGRHPLPLLYGQNAEISGILRPPKARGEYPLIFSDVRRVEGERGHKVLKFLYGVRRANSEGLRRIFPADAGALMSGLTLGTTEGMSAETREAMRQSGSTHLVALSGYNVAILIFALTAMLRKFMSRRQMWLAVSGFLFLFMIMSGSEPSIMRASFMGFALLWAKELGRIYSFPHATIFAAVLMLLVDPLLVRNPGFQLSFASLLGIAYGSDLLLPSLQKVRVPAALQESAAFTLSAQIAVLPILLLNFGEISLWALPANLLILPFVPLAMGLGFALIGLQWILPPLASAFALFPRILLEYDLLVMRFFGGGDAVFQFSGSLLFFAAYYSILALWWWRPLAKIKIAWA